MPTTRRSPGPRRRGASNCCGRSSTRSGTRETTARAEVSALLAQLTTPAFREDLRVDRDRQRDVAADEDRFDHVRLVAPGVVLAQHAVRIEVGDQHRRPLAVERRPAVGAVQTEHAGELRAALAVARDLQIADEMTRGRVPALLTPDIERTDPVLPLEPVVADREQAVIDVEFVRVAAGVEIDLEPIAGLEAIACVPER